MSQITQEELDWENNTAIIRWENNHCRKCNYCFNEDLDNFDEDSGDFEEDELNCPKCNTFNILK